MASPIPISNEIEHINLEFARDPKDLMENAFVLTAVGIPRSIEVHLDHWVMSVPKDQVVEAKNQLALYESEKKSWHTLSPLILDLAIPPVALWGFALMMLGFFVYQNVGNAELILQRASSVSDVFQTHQWWRSITALFLHADSLHFGGNFLFGMSFIFLLLAMMGHGLTAFGLLISGSLGNLANSYFYRNIHHQSIGSSTAVFGALGVWASFSVFEMLKNSESQALWRKLIRPVGAALAVLGIWGSSPESDYMAHFWGFLVGLLYGSLVYRLNLHKICPPKAQAFLSLSVVTIVAAAWYWALG